MSLIYIADLDIADASNIPVTLKFSTKLTFTNTSQTYTAKIRQPAFIGQALDFGEALGGAMTSTIGELILVNTKRDLDYLKTYIVADKTLTLKLYDTTQALATATTVLVQKIEQLVFEWDQVSVRLQNSATLLDRPLQTQKFLGNNIVAGVLGTGLEGVADIKDKPKPLLFGRVHNASTIQVNSQLLAYQISTNPIDMITNVLTNGNYITPMGSMPGTLALFKSTAVTPGFYSKWTDSTGTYIKLGMAPDRLTISVIDNLDPQLNSAAALIQAILTYAGFTSANWVATDFTALDAKNASQIGLEVQDEETIATIITRICISVGAYWGFDGNNKFRVFHFGTLTGTPLVTIKSIDSSTGINVEGITSCEIASVSYNGNYKIVYRVVVLYDKNWDVLEKNSIAGAVPTDRVNWLSAEYRKEIAENTTVKANYPASQKLRYGTNLVSKKSAAAEAARVLTLVSVPRNIVTLSVRLQTSDLQKLIPTGLVNVVIPRYGMTTGINFLITSVEINYEDSTANLTLWG